MAHIAVETENEKLLQYLVSEPGINLNKKDGKGQTVSRVVCALSERLGRAFPSFRVHAPSRVVVVPLTVTCAAVVCGRVGGSQSHRFAAG